MTTEQRLSTVEKTSMLTSRGVPHDVAANAAVLLGPEEFEQYAALFRDHLAKTADTPGRNPVEAARLQAERCQEAHRFAMRDVRKLRPKGYEPSTLLKQSAAAPAVGYEIDAVMSERPGEVSYVEAANIVVKRRRARQEDFDAVRLLAERAKHIKDEGVATDDEIGATVRILRDAPEEAIERYILCRRVGQNHGEALVTACDTPGGMQIPGETLAAFVGRIPANAPEKQIQGARELLARRQARAR